MNANLLFITGNAARAVMELERSAAGEKVAFRVLPALATIVRTEPRAEVYLAALKVSPQGLAADIDAVVKGSGVLGADAAARLRKTLTDLALEIRNDALDSQLIYSREPGKGA